MAQGIVRRTDIHKIVVGKYFQGPESMTDGKIKKNLIKILEVEKVNDIVITPEKIDVNIITYDINGGLCTCTERELKAILAEGYYVDVTVQEESRQKQERSNPEYLAALKLEGRFIYSPDGKYLATVKSPDPRYANVQIKVKGLDVESTFRQTYPLKDFSLDKIFTPSEITRLDSIYGSTSDETLLAISVADKLDKDAEKSFWQDAAARGQELGFSEILIRHAKQMVEQYKKEEQEERAKTLNKYGLDDVKNFADLAAEAIEDKNFNIISSDKNGDINIMEPKDVEQKVNRIMDILKEPKLCSQCISEQNPNNMYWEKGFCTCSNNRGKCGKPYDNKKPIEPRFNYEEESNQLREEMVSLGYVDDKTNQYVERPKEVKIEKQSLFEVIGVWRHNKDEKFTIVGADINAELMAKIQFVKPDMKVYSVKRISAIDVL